MRGTGAEIPAGAGLGESICKELARHKPGVSAICLCAGGTFAASTERECSPGCSSVLKCTAMGVFAFVEAGFSCFQHMLGCMCAVLGPGVLVVVEHSCNGIRSRRVPAACGVLGCV